MNGSAAYSAVKFFHCSECIVTVLEVNEAVVLGLLDTSHLAVRLKHLPQLILSHQRLEVFHVQHFHLQRKQQRKPAARSLPTFPHFYQHASLASNPYKWYR